MSKVYKSCALYDTRRARHEDRPCEGAFACHPLPLGTDVAIFRPAPSGLVSREGQAVIHGFTQIPHLYHVKFDGERSARERLVFQAFQTDPEALEKALAYLFRHDMLTPPSHDEFFPHHRRF